VREGENNEFFAGPTAYARMADECETVSDGEWLWAGEREPGVRWRQAAGLGK